MRGALKVLYNNGYNAISMDTVAEAVRADPRDLAEEYASPVEILIDIIKWAMRFGESLEREFARDKDPLDKIEHYVLMHFAFLSSHPEMATLLLADESISGSRRVHSKLLQLRKHRLEILMSILSHPTIRSAWGDEKVEQLALLILGYMRMTIANWKQSNQRESLWVHGNIAAGFTREIISSGIISKKGHLYDTDTS